VSEAGLLRRIATAPDFDHALTPARQLVLLRRWGELGRPVISRLSLGPRTHVLSLPSEVVVAYQLFAQELVPEHFLATAAYGQFSQFYIPTAAMFREGGYEPRRAFYTPRIEENLKGAIARVLARLR
jgi:hypothetical protein